MEMEYDEAFERALDEGSDGGYDFGGLEGEEGRFELGSPYAIIVSFFFIVLSVFVDWIILAKQTSCGLIWPCYPLT